MVLVIFTRSGSYRFRWAGGITCDARAQIGDVFNLCSVFSPHRGVESLAVLHERSCVW